MGQRSSVYLADGLAAGVKASGQPLAGLIRRGFTAGAGHGTQAAVDEAVTTSPPSALPPGEPSPGVLCMGSRCYSATPHGTASALSPCAPPAQPPLETPHTSAKHPHAPRTPPPPPPL